MTKPADVVTPASPQELRLKLLSFLSILRDMRKFSRREYLHMKRVGNQYETGARYAEVCTMSVVIAELERLTHGD
jgi:hypothetical protein